MCDDKIFQKIILKKIMYSDFVSFQRQKLDTTVENLW